jgi:hypothetical protein
VVAVFVGQVIGTAVSTRIFLDNGWRVCYGVALGWTAIQVIILLLRGPHLPTDRWFGWAGGWAVRKAQPPAVPVTGGDKALPEASADASDAGNDEKETV